MDAFYVGGVQAAKRARRNKDKDDAIKRRKLVAATKPSSGLGVVTSAPVVTLCSGIEAVIQGYEQLKVIHVHAVACEIDKATRETLLHNFKPQKMFVDLRQLHPSDLPRDAILWAGFPCQPFSAEGPQDGPETERGLLIVHIMHLIKERQPVAFVLENVKGLVTHFKDFFEDILAVLRSFKHGGRFYNVEYRILDTKFLGIPQSRPRLYIVGIRSDRQDTQMHWPVHHNTPCMGILKCMDDACTLSRAALMRKRPPTTQSHANKMYDAAIKKISDGGKDPFKHPFVLDLDARSETPAYMEGISPCLTKTRAMSSGHWITTHGRRFSTRELLRLQSMDPDRLQKPADVSGRLFNGMVGNSMSINVIKTVILMIGRSAPSIIDVRGLKDKWSLA